MAYTYEPYKGSKLHVQAQRQKQFFLAGLIIICLLFALAYAQHIALWESCSTLFILLWCLCMPLAFNGAVCEVCVVEIRAGRTPSRALYYGGLIAALAIPIPATLTAVVLTGQYAYLVIVIVALYFPLRNHHLLRLLKRSSVA